MNKLIPFCASLFVCAILSLAARAEGPAAHAEADNQFVERHTCRNGADERVLQVLPVEKGCTLEYIKGGKAEVKAKSVRSVVICQEALQKIRKRLESSGYACQTN